MKTAVKIFTPKHTHLDKKCYTCDGRAVIMYSSEMRDGERVYACSRHCERKANFSGASFK